MFRSFRPIKPIQNVSHTLPPPSHLMGAAGEIAKVLRQIHHARGAPFQKIRSQFDISGEREHLFGVATSGRYVGEMGAPFQQGFGGRSIVQRFRGAVVRTVLF